MRNGHGVGHGLDLVDTFRMADTMSTMANSTSQDDSDDG
jgi:hypothetical protein